VKQYTIWFKSGISVGILAAELATEMTKDGSAKLVARYPALKGTAYGLVIGMFNVEEVAGWYQNQRSEQ